MGRHLGSAAAAAVLLLPLCLAQPALLWSYSGGAGFPSSPAVADLDGDGILEVVVGSHDTNVYCLLGDGGFEWKYKTGGPVVASPLAVDLDGDGRREVLAGSSDGTLYVLNGTGEHRWHFDTSGPISAAPAAGDIDGDGLVEIVVGSEDNVVRALGSKGVLLWERDVGGDVLADPLVADLDGDGAAEVLVGSDNGALTRIDGATGAVRWTHPVPGRVRSAPAAADLDGDGAAEVLVGSDDGTLELLSADGTRRWTFRTGGAVTAAPLAADIDGDLALEVIVGSSEGGLYVLDRSGALRWNTGRGAVTACPAAGDLDGDGRMDIAYPTGENTTRVIDAIGAELWSFPMRYPSRGTPVIADLRGAGTLDLLFTSLDGKVYAFGFKRRPQVISQYQDRAHVPRSRAPAMPASAPASVDLAGVERRLDALEGRANETLRKLDAVPGQVNCTSSLIPSRNDQQELATNATRSFRTLASIVLGGAALLAAILLIVLRQHRAGGALSRPTIYVDGTHGNFVGEGSANFRQLFAVLAGHGNIVHLTSFFLQPKEGDILVIGVPRKPFTREEVSLIDGYVERTGLRLLLVAEWGGDQKNNEHLNQLTGEYGAYFNPDLICDYDKGGAVSYTPVLEGLASHPITRGLIGVRINAACSITIENRKVQPLVWGSKQSFSDQNFNLMPDEFEKKGYIVFMAGLEHGRGKVVMVGDSDLFNDANLKGYHLALLHNVLAWFASPVDIEWEPSHIGSGDVVRLLRMR